MLQRLLSPCRGPCHVVSAASRFLTSTAIVSAASEANPTRTPPPQPALCNRHDAAPAFAQPANTPAHAASQQHDAAADVSTSEPPASSAGADAAIAHGNAAGGSLHRTSVSDSGPSVSSLPSAASSADHPSRPSLPNLPELRVGSRASRLHGAVSQSAAAVTEKVREVQIRATEAAKRRLIDLGRALNDLTGYSGVEVLKRNVEEADQRLALLQQQLQVARAKYEDELSTQSLVQKEMNSLLQRKSMWTEPDVGRFAELCRLEHRHEGQVVQMRSAYDDALEAVEASQMELMKIVRDRYVEESLWSDKIRRAQTWYTWGLVGVNLLSFVVIYTVVEPRKQRRLAATVSALLEQHQAAQSGIVQRAVHDTLRSAAAAAAVGSTNGGWPAVDAADAVGSDSSASGTSSDATTLGQHTALGGGLGTAGDLGPSSAFNWPFGSGHTSSSSTASSSHAVPDGGPGIRAQLDEGGIAALRAEVVAAVRGEVQSLRQDFSEVLAASAAVAGGPLPWQSDAGDACAGVASGAGRVWDGQDVVAVAPMGTAAPRTVSRRTAGMLAGTAAVAGAVGTWLVLLALASGKRG